MKLDYITYSALVFSVLSALYLIKRTFDLTEPSFPFSMGLALVLASLFYGARKGIRGNRCGPSWKSWVLAGNMVFTGLLTIAGIVLVAVLDLGFPEISVNEGYLTRFVVQVILVGVVSFILCRYAFILGVKRGYSMFLKKMGRNA
ncbi:hypothetical protein [Ruegeria lacuscaerulensis]|uniref:hypothetical protein n=1 Tax=Ruegeria lacuscaerulensis TaxID=55218 RepID=UPI00147DF0DB|nr:hypothetical protein [Ruegeria lacuscaerulensis]